MSQSHETRFTTFGIVGYGHFGQLLAASLARRGKVLVADVDPAKLATANDEIRASSLAEVASADVAILAVPFSALANVLNDIRDHLLPSTVVMDVVSTKVRAAALLEGILGEHPNVLATHPLFGPPSMEKLEPGLRLVVTHERGPRAVGFEQFLESEFGLEIVRVPAEEHDRAMAYMQSLPFFIARALMSLDVLQHPYLDELAIPSFEKLTEIAAIEEQHTMDMFDTSQISNPYADEARRRFLDVLGDLQHEIAQHAARNPDLER